MADPTFTGQPAGAVYQPPTGQPGAVYQQPTGQPAGVVYQPPPPGGYPAGHIGYPAGHTGYPQGQPGYGYNQPANIVVAQPVLSGVTPPDNLILSIVSCFACFWPVGIFAIVYALKSQSAARQNDMVKATSYSQRARTLSFIAIAVGSITIILAIVFALAFPSRSYY